MTKNPQWNPTFCMKWLCTFDFDSYIFILLLIGFFRWIFIPRGAFINMYAKLCKLLAELLCFFCHAHECNALNFPFLFWLPLLSPTPSVPHIKCSVVWFVRFSQRTRSKNGAFAKNLHTFSRSLKSHLKYFSKNAVCVKCKSLKSRKVYKLLLFPHSNSLW